MTYLLDTNICIYIIKRKPLRVFDKFKGIRPDYIGISSITYTELTYGVAKSNNIEQNRDALQNFIVPLEIFSFNDLAALAYGEIRALLERSGQVIGALNMLIAAHALSLNKTLITNNTREFTRIPDLKVENWINK